MNVRIRYKEGSAHYNKVKEIYQSLCTRELLKKCEGHFTQNANEAFNNKITKICPKRKYFAFPHYKFAIAQSILNSHLGYELGNILNYYFNIETTVAMKSLWRSQEYSRKRIIKRRPRRNLKEFPLRYGQEGYVRPSYIPGGF